MSSRAGIVGMNSTRPRSPPMYVCSDARRSSWLSRSSMNDWPELTAWLSSQAGDYGVYVCTAAGQTLYSYRADVVRPAASLIKVAIALTLDHHARCCTLRLDDTVELTED